MTAIGRVKESITRARERSPLLDHVIRTVEHYGSVKGSQQAGAVTYFGFLSFFPVMALAFFAIGYVARVYPDAQDQLVTALDEVLPGLIGGGDNEISLDQVQDSASAVGLIGLAGVLYAGLGWLSALRDALIVVFELPEQLQPNFVIGKIRDLTSLLVLGLVLVLSVAVSGVITRFSTDVLDLAGLGGELAPLLAGLAVVLGVLAGSLLFFAMFRLLADPKTPRRSLWAGAVLGAVGFEVLKQLSGFLLGATKGQPAFQAFGIALILVVWINYFSRVVLYAAAWAHTSPAARALRGGDPAAVQGPQSPPLPWREQLAADRAAESATSRFLTPFAAGGATMLALVAVLKKKGR